MRMQGNNNMLSPVQVIVHVFDLIGIHMRHGMRNRYRQIDNHRILCSRLPNINDSIADFQCKFRLCSRKAFRRIFEAEMTGCLFPIFLTELCAKYSKVDNFFLTLFKDLFPLCNRSRVVQMYNGMLHTLERFKGLGNDMLSCLRQNLNGNIVRDQILFNQCAAKFIFCLRSSRKTNFNFFESNFYQILKELQFFFQAHRCNQCLIAIPQVYAAPDRRMIDIIFLCPAHWRIGNRIKLSGILFHIFHKSTNSFPW